MSWSVRRFSLRWCEADRLPFDNKNKPAASLSVVAAAVGFMPASISKSFCEASRQLRVFIVRGFTVVPSCRVPHTGQCPRDCVFAVSRVLWNQQVACYQPLKAARIQPPPPSGLPQDPLTIVRGFRVCGTTAFGLGGGREGSDSRRAAGVRLPESRPECLGPRCVLCPVRRIRRRSLRVSASHGWR